MAIIAALTVVMALWSATSADIICDVVIVGGTLAALGAVIEAPSQYKTCLIEPTDRIGGQLGDEGVWHIDFNWLYQKGYPDNTTAYNHENLHSFMK